MNYFTVYILVALKLFVSAIENMYGLSSGNLKPQLYLVRLQDVMRDEVTVAAGLLKSFLISCYPTL